MPYDAMRCASFFIRTRHYKAQQFVAFFFFFFFFTTIAFYSSFSFWSTAQTAHLLSLSSLLLLFLLQLLEKFLSAVRCDAPSDSPMLHERH
jgi:hypothetical protein